MRQNHNYQIGHAYVDNQVIMYKLYLKHTKNSYIRATRDHQIEVIASTYMSDKQLKEFINKHIGKIYTHIKQKNDRQLIDSNFNHLHVFSKKYLIKTVKTISRKSYIFIGGVLYLHIKSEADKLTLIKKMYLVETSPYVKKRFEYWEKNMNLHAKLLFKWMKSKWGVCDVSHKQITLSLQLSSYDKNVIDYVIVHELAHLVHPNHSTRFWEYVNKYIPNWKQLRNTINLR